MTVSQFRSASYPVLPDPEPLDGTLLSVVTPEEIEASGRVLINNPTGLFPSYGCMVSGLELGALCGPFDGSKFTDAPSPDWVDGVAFGAYGAVVCKMATEDEIRDGVDAAYDAAEPRVIERGLMALMEANPDGSGLPGEWAAATDITPASLLATGGVDPVVGMGLLESHMGANYAGKGILHIPRVAASYLAQQGSIDWGPDNDQRLLTTLKTPVAAGPGYDLPNIGPDGDEAPAGSKWLYGTGRVVVRKVRLDSRAMINIYGQSADDEAPNYVPGLEPNDMVGIAEGVYLVAVDCYKAAVLVKLYEEA